MSLKIERDIIEISVNFQNGAVFFRESIKTFDDQILISETNNHRTTISPDRSDRIEAVNAIYSNPKLISFLENIWENLPTENS